MFLESAELDCRCGATWKVIGVAPGRMSITDCRECDTFMRYVGPGASSVESVERKTTGMSEADVDSRMPALQAWAEKLPERMNDADKRELTLTDAFNARQAVEFLTVLLEEE